MNLLHYKFHKPALRKEFSYCCVYCDVTEPELGGSQSFCVDHYRPKSKFPALITEYNNLLYACRHCNAHKGNYWPKRLHRILQWVVLNPRIFKHKPERHLDKSELIWKNKTAQGKWNLNRLRLNSLRQVELRRHKNNLQKTIKFLQKNHTLLCQQLMFAERENAADLELKKMKMEIASFANQIDSLESKISGSMD